MLGWSVGWAARVVSPFDIGEDIVTSIYKQPALEVQSQTKTSHVG